MSTENTHDAIQAGIQIAGIAPRIAEVRGIPVAVIISSDGNDEIRVLDEVLEESDKRAPAPQRRKGTSTHFELASFIAHVNRFKDADSAIFADVGLTSLTAVLNYHPGGKTLPRWGDHRSVYTCPLSREWKLWLSANEKPFAQDAFGDFVDANMADLASSPQLEEGIAQPAAVLQMARSLVVLTKGEFTRVINPTTGEGKLVNKTENESTSTPIPRAFLLQLPVFESGELYRVEARVRFAMKNGVPSFSYSLYQTDVILRDAFGAVRKAVAEGTSLPVFAGSPEK